MYYKHDRVGELDNKVMIIDKKCTVLMCTYNAEKYIVEQLDSLRQQTYSNFSVVIYDDNSIDNTVSIIQDYAQCYNDEIKIKLKINKDNSGGACENFKRVTNDYSDEQYVFYCDQDDIWEANKIEVMVEKMIYLEEKKVSPYIVCHNCAVSDANGYVIQHGKIKDLSLKHLVYYPAVQGCCMMLNHEALAKLQIKNAVISMHDWYACLVVAACGSIELIDTELIRYRQHSNNQVGYSKKSFVHSVKEMIKLNSKYYRYHIMMEQLHSVACAVPENQFLARFKQIYEEKQYFKLIVFFFEEKVLGINIHSIYQGIITYLSCKKTSYKR